MNGVWKVIAVGLLSFVLGGGISTVFGQLTVSKLEDDLKLIQNKMAEEIQAGKEKDHLLELRLVSIEGLLKYAIGQHHPGMDVEIEAR